MRQLSLILFVASLSGASGCLDAADQQPVDGGSDVTAPDVNDVTAPDAGHAGPPDYPVGLAIPACVERPEVPAEGLFIELYWVTPVAGEICPSEPSTRGADLDLRLDHPMADPAWNDVEWTCSYLNPEPLWSAENAEANPRMIHDSRNGAEAERIHLPGPEAGLNYGVAVAFWQDNGFGPTQAVVRVVHDGALVAEVVSPQLWMGQLWWVGDFHDGVFEPSSADDSLSDAVFPPGVGGN